jgi:hypothetical protein
VGTGAVFRNVILDGSDGGEQILQDILTPVEILDVVCIG